MAAKRRADQLLVEQGLAESRAKAQALILAGLVSTAGRRVDKPGEQLVADSALVLKGRDYPWVSRGGVKLAHALDHFQIDVEGLIALDIGASTGVTCDASFIGLATVLPAPLALAAEQAQLVALVKPQFEAGREHVGKGGVVRDPIVQREVCERAAAWVAAQPGWTAVGIVESPILGPEGNREFLLYARRGG